MLMHSKNCHIYQRQFSFVDELTKAKRPPFRENFTRLNSEQNLV